MMLQMPTVAPSALSLGAVVTLMVVTLGPIKILGPFANQTQGMDDKLVRQIAMRAFLFSVAALIVSGVAGVTMLAKWHISVPALSLAGGLIFLIVGLRIVLEQYAPSAHHPAPLPASPTAAALKFTFPTIVTPYGIAAVMALLARSQDESRTAIIVGVVVLVMLLNYGAMLVARKTMSGVTVMVLWVVGAVLGVLQVALALEMIIVSLQQLGVISGPPM